MILGIGVDSVEIQRFRSWSLYSRSQLSRIFSEQEITYCLQNPIKSAERFAARFAAREAFFKALSTHKPNHTIPFLTVCRLITIEREGNVPRLIIDWTQIIDYQPIISIHTLLSLTHTQKVATAFVVLES
jgi:holo-[acyl-carrier protein] synthase